MTGGVRLAELPDEAGGHVGVAVDFCSLEPLPLYIPGAFHPLPDRRGAFSFAPVGELAVFYRRDLDVDVDPVQKRPGDAGAVALDHDGCAGALVLGIAAVSAVAGIHGGDEHEAGRVGDGHEGPGDGDPAILQGLAQDLQDVFLEFGEFIEKEDAVVGEGDLPRSGGIAAVILYK